MKFGPVPLADAEGAILAHSVILDGGKIAKGTVLGADEIARLGEAGHDAVIVARLEDGDIGEDAAAEALGKALTGHGVTAEPAFTGRGNLFAEAAGIFAVDRATIDDLNRLDPGLTLATLPAFSPVEARRMVATVKIIPYAVPKAALDAALALVAERGPVLSLHPYRVKRVAVVSTLLPGLKEKVVDKTLRILADRLAPACAEIVAEERVAHDAEAVAAAIARLAPEAELLILFGASAVADRHDVLPTAIEQAGGAVSHFGMPVDPGNLLLVGRFGDVPVIGAPGCARSPRENGFDWVLARLLAGLQVTPDDITGMGVGGLLMEIVSRPQPREGPVAEPGEKAPEVAALILAAGRAARMGGPNKLLATVDGTPLVAHAAKAASDSRASSVTAVTGHRAEEVDAILKESDIRIIHNPDYMKGLSSSLAAGIKALPETADAVLVLLADMPRVTAETLDRLIAAFDPEAGAHIVVPTSGGKRGNPVLWSRRYFEALSSITGDVGARHLIGENADAVVEVEIGAEVALDLDTPEALAAIGGRLPEEGTPVNDNDRKTTGRGE
ncbi:molybdenum cofactor cytidylyltransferase [Rhodobium orientis]|uniref:4-diphosphocytidyl-2C-methyl-D-erythritol kinase n=1 Tax=Rhodobium orientis TaxID=34017 RepID=A0A327JKY8_9HYPH|nr:molybdopterin-binding/glycosyltransferase family 2 protein [Rhodobium orientis]MBB4302046.1 molybdenum cofactor cytidylyltransferase [Rhodobium orientis]MBK5950283.1 4-diphosphocytidyl-2C-methyl-D-erythritol kinase [Rhodobium orientis]RAI25973.1 4-diphosphocytidyl-2C-methyl-D-erythritol kinase [Rhodobium orientis]